MQSFYQKFVESAERWPQNVALEMQRQDSVERYTYAEVRRMAESVGRWLQENGVARGATCGILAGNGPRWTAAYLGILAAGAVAVPFDTAFSRAQVATILRDSGAVVLLADARLLPLAQRAVEGLNVRLVCLDSGPRELPSFDKMQAAGPGNFRSVPVADDDLAAILYTSGTTSDPKGVMLTHANIAAEADAVFRTVDVLPSDSLLGVLPLFHALAQMANLLLPLLAGARIVYLESLNTTELVRALRERHITIFACVPQFFYLIHERIMKQVAGRGAAARAAFRLLMALSRLLRVVGWKSAGKLFFRQVHEAVAPGLRFFVVGGSRFDPAVGRDLQALGLEILQAYGLTETSGAATVTPLEHNVMGSIGRPLPGVEVKIVGAEASGDGPAAGEIAIRGGIVMQGYFKRPDATAAVLRDGWLSTGDLGYVDASGDLYITGRKKEIIVLSSGKNIYPEEIEEYYLKSQWIKELCVVGLESRPGEPVSERLHAVIVPNLELLKQKKIVNTREVIRFDLDSISATLPSTKRILSYEIWQEDLPRTTTRKVKRFEVLQRVLAAQAAAGGAAVEERHPLRTLSPDDQAWLAEPEVARALAAIRRASKKEGEIHPADNLELDLGLDSMERVELLVALERELDSHLPDTVVSEVYTVRELVDAVRSAGGDSADLEKKRALRARGASGWDTVFQTESSDPEVLEVVSRPRRLVPFLWFFGGRFVDIFCRDLFRLRVTGLEKIPADGPFILSPNHQSFLDAPVVMSQLPWQLYKKVFYVGTSEIFGSGLMRRIAHSLRLIPVDPDANLVPAMRAGAYGLKRGQILVLYPEGERSIDGTPKTFKKGAAILATHLKVPILPIALEGFHDAWPRGQGFRRFAPLRIAIGDPIYPPEKVSDSEAAYEQLTAELRERVVGMWHQLRREMGKEGPAEPAAGQAAAD
ncbi:MAG TPA: AMP-binding protein [Terriglobales bacterium]|jgi:long-chain acyl-CoA synthetase|nr:AMP-binding protein [Terriglobales bacterium]